MTQQLDHIDTLGSTEQHGKQLAKGTEWWTLYKRAQEILPDAFRENGRVLNLIEGEWGYPGNAKYFVSPCDGTHICTFPMLDAESARKAVRFAATEHETWSKLDLDERRLRVVAALDQMRRHRELIALFLVWEIGKPYRQAMVSVDRCITGVEWYVENIDRMLEGRKPLGLISNIASWNYPLSVLVHAMLVQALAGNAVIAKTPTDGGLCALTLAIGLARRCGLPVTLVSGSGGQLSEALVRNDDVACLSFVGGKTSGRDIAASLYDREKRYMLEMEGVNAYGIWGFSDWPTLAGQLKKGFEFGKQRCTAYARFVIQRELFPHFLCMYLPMVSSLKIGHPLLVNSPEEQPPDLAFGPLINSKAAEELRVKYSEALGKGALSIYEGALDPSMLFDGQDISAYVAPAALLNVPRNTALYYNEPFGPLDTFVIVDRIEELVAEMNVSNGCLVSSVACDDEKTARRIMGELRAFKVGWNQVRSRGDREEPFGGIGESWKGCFVGGEFLVQGVTEGPAGSRLYGNFPDHTLLPDKR